MLPATINNLSFYLNASVVRQKDGQLLILLRKRAFVGAIPVEEQTQTFDRHREDDGRVLLR